MRLDPVYLIQPEPKKPAISRRKVLAAGVALFGAGAAGGWLLAKSATLTGSAGPGLAWIQRVSEGSINQLVARQVEFLAEVAAYSFGDAPRAAWLGLERLGTYVITTDTLDPSVRTAIATDLLPWFDSEFATENCVLQRQELRVVAGQ